MRNPLESAYLFTTYLFAPTSLPLTSLPPAFKPPISLSPTTSKKFNPYYTSTLLRGRLIELLRKMFSIR